MLRAYERKGKNMNSFQRILQPCHCQKRKKERKSRNWSGSYIWCYIRCQNNIALGICRGVRIWSQTLFVNIVALAVYVRTDKDCQVCNLFISKRYLWIIRRFNSFDLNYLLTSILEIVINIKIYHELGASNAKNVYILGNVNLSMCLIMPWRDTGEWRYSFYILCLGIWWRWVVSFPPRPFYPGGNLIQCQLDRWLGGPQS